MSYYSYVVPRDYGFAPNPFGKYCTLATCKPKIRKSAQLGDWIFGTTSIAGRKLPRLVYAMQVTKKITYNQYFNDSEFSYKKPVMNGSLKKMYGDNIYHTEEINGVMTWIQDDSHHSYENGKINLLNLRRDTSCEYVLISDNFYYLGKDAILIPQNFVNHVCKKGPGFRKLNISKGQSFINFIARNSDFTPGYNNIPLNFNTFKRYNGGSLRSDEQLEPKVLVVHKKKSDEYIRKIKKLLKDNGFDAVISSTYKFKNITQNMLEQAINTTLVGVSKVIFLVSNETNGDLVFKHYIRTAKENGKLIIGVPIENPSDDLLKTLNCDNIRISDWNNESIISALTRKMHDNVQFLKPLQNGSINDVYLCYAKEENETIIKPLIRAFELENISFWYDEFEILWGDSLSLKIKKGLFSSRFVIVVISESFIEKYWTKTEMELAIKNEKKILPLLHGDSKKLENIISRSFPELNIKDIKYLIWDGNTIPVIKELNAILK